MHAKIEFEVPHSEVRKLGPEKAAEAAHLQMALQLSRSVVSTTTSQELDTLTGKKYSMSFHVISSNNMDRINTLISEIVESLPMPEQWQQDNPGKLKEIYTLLGE